ncbi:hypothetical protein [Diaphorobacter nitroreducens]
MSLKPTRLRRAAYLFR